MLGAIGTVVSGIKGCVVAGMAVRGGGTRSEVGARRHKTWRGGVVSRGVAVGGRRGVEGGVR